MSEGREERRLAKYRQVLRALASGLLITLGLLAGLFTLLALWVWFEKPIRTVGTHGMLPEELGSWLAAALFGLAAGAAWLGTALAALARLRSVLGYVAAALLGLALLWHLHAPFLPYFAEGVVLGVSLVFSVAGAALLGLTGALWLGTRRVAEAWPRWLVHPVALGLVILLASLGLRGAQYLAIARWQAREERELRHNQARAERNEAEARRRFEHCSRSDELAQFCGSVRAMGLSADGQWLATFGKQLVMWNVASGKAAWRVDLEANHFNNAAPVWVTNDGQRVINAESYSVPTWFDAQGGHAKLDVCGARSTLARATALSSRGHVLVAGERLCLYGPDNWETGTALPVDCRAEDVAFTPDAAAIWIACGSKLLKLDVASRRPTLQIDAETDGTTWSGVSLPNYFAAFVPADGARVLAVSHSAARGCQLNEWSGDGKPLSQSQLRCRNNQALTWSEAFVSFASDSGEDFVNLQTKLTHGQELPGSGERRLAASRDGHTVFVAKAQGDGHAPAPTVFRFRPEL